METENHVLILRQLSKQEKTKSNYFPSHSNTDADNPQFLFRLSQI